MRILTFPLLLINRFAHVSTYENKPWFVKELVDEMYWMKDGELSDTSRT